MALNNPAFSNSSAFNGRGATIPTPSAQQLRQQFDLPSAPGSRAGRPMTIDGTLRVSLGTFTVLLAGAAVGWMSAALIPPLWIGALIVGTVLAFVNIFKKEPSPALILSYAGAEGLFLGGISSLFERMWPGVVSQAVVATLVVVGVTLALFANGKIRASKRATKIFIIVMVGYLVFSLLNLGGMLFGLTDNPWGLRGSIEIMGIPLGLVLGVLAVLLGAYSLVLDFDYIQRGVRQQVPAKYQWTGAFGIMMTIIWLYIEILRLIAISRD